MNAILLLLATALFATVRPEAAEDARAILDASGVKGGLVVHLGCGDGTLTAALGDSKSYTVHARR